MTSGRALWLRFTDSLAQLLSLLAILFLDLLSPGKVLLEMKQMTSQFHTYIILLVHPRHYHNLQMFILIIQGA